MKIDRACCRSYRPEKMVVARCLVSTVYYLLGSTVVVREIGAKMQRCCIDRTTSLRRAVLVVRVVVVWAAVNL